MMLNLYFRLFLSLCSFLWMKSHQPQAEEEEKIRVRKNTWKKREKEEKTEETLKERKGISYSAVFNYNWTDETASASSSSPSSPVASKGVLLKTMNKTHRVYAATLPRPEQQERRGKRKKNPTNLRVKNGCKKKIVFFFVGAFCVIVFPCFFFSL